VHTSIGYKERRSSHEYISSKARTPRYLSQGRGNDEESEIHRSCKTTEASGIKQKAVPLASCHKKSGATDDVAGSAACTYVIKWHRQAALWKLLQSSSILFRHVDAKIDQAV